MLVALSSYFHLLNIPGEIAYDQVNGMHIIRKRLFLMTKARCLFEYDAGEQQNAIIAIYIQLPKFCRSFYVFWNVEGLTSRNEIFIVENG